MFGYSYLFVKVSFVINVTRAVASNLLFLFQPSVSLTAATDGSDEDDLMSGTSTFLMILMLSILV